jgi:hypothetical protein
MRMIHHQCPVPYLLLHTLDSERRGDVAPIAGIPGRKFRPGKLKDQFLHGILEIPLLLHKSACKNLFLRRFPAEERMVYEVRIPC